MFDNITPEERQNSRRTDPAYLKARKAKFFHQQAQSEAEDSSGQPANVTPIIEALNSSSTGNDFGNSYWFGLLVVVLFLGAIFLTNSCLGL